MNTAVGKDDKRGCIHIHARLMTQTALNAVRLALVSFLPNCTDMAARHQLVPKAYW